MALLSFRKNSMHFSKRSGKTNVVVVVVIAVFALWVCGGLAVSLILPAVKMARDASRRTVSTNNMKQLGLALYHYHSLHKTFPPAFIADEDGQPRTSWRALLLPLMAPNYQDDYDFNVAWDDPKNLAALEKYRNVYASPFVGEDGYTSYLAVVGPSTVISTDEQVQLQDVTDGTYVTLCVIEDFKSPVPWSAPIDISPEELLTRYEQKDFPNRMLVLMVDGSVHEMPLGSPQALKAMIFRDDGLTPY